MPRITATGLVLEVSGRHPVRGASLTVRAGEAVGLVGRRGSGKTTLLSLLAGVQEPTFGAVMLCGTSLRGTAGPSPMVSIMPQYRMLESVDLASEGIEIPPVLLLDEPTAGRSPPERERFWRWLELVRLTGRAVLVTLDLDDVDDCQCDRIYLIENGATMASGSTADLIGTVPPAISSTSRAAQWRT